MTDEEKRDLPPFPEENGEPEPISAPSAELSPEEMPPEAELPAGDDGPERPAPEAEEPPAEDASPETERPARRGVPRSSLRSRMERNEEERNYRPVRSRRDGQIGCLGGLMYMVFILCASVVLACFGWMAASDVLALNKENAAVEVTLPESAFFEKEVELTDEDGKVTGTKTIQAADIDQVSSILRDYGLINYRWLFKFYSGFSHADEKLDPGTYELSTNLDYRAIVTKLQSGSGSQLETLVMLPEGYNMDQIFAKLEENGVCRAEELYKAAAEAEFSYAFLAGTVPGDPVRLEGFLFPDSYYFYQGMQASSAINKFLSNMYYKLTDEMLQQAANMGLTFQQVLTVASLVEKEAANDDERALIASVIYNRLNVGMPLQFDSTVHYALRGTDITAINTDIIQSTDSPYNTYLYTGLPPTPICNPGMPSIQAALNPASSRYLFFALDMESNSMRFFITAEEHAAFAATQNYG